MGNERIEDITGGYENFTERGGFEEICETYDLEALRYFADGAKALVDEMELAGTEKILDVGTGTGHLAFELSRRYQNADILGVDMSDGMLGKAIAKQEQNNCNNLNFKKANWENLQVLDGQFDVVANSFGVSFISNIDNFIQSVLSKLKPHSKFAFVNFIENGFTPFIELMCEDISRMGIELTFSDIEPANEQIITLLNNNDFVTKKKLYKTLKYKITTTEDWWTIISKTAIKENFFYNAPEEKIEEFKKVHLSHVQEMLDRGENILSVPVMIAVLER